MTIEDITAEQLAMWAIAGDDMLPMNQLPLTLHEMHRRVAQAIRQHGAKLRADVQRLEGQVRVRSRIMDRLPLCPDHRDKIRDRCVECENERLRQACRDAGGALWHAADHKATAAEDRFVVAYNDLKIDRWEMT